MGDSVGPTKKRPPHLSPGGVSSPKKARTPDLAPGADEEDDDSTEELTRLLEGPEVAPFKVRFVPYPYTWQSIYESCSPASSSYITINVGNEESCGSSFSDSDTSVMASVDLRGFNIAGWSADGGNRNADGGAWRDGGRVARGWVAEDAGDWDDLDEALATFIGDD